MDHVAEQIAYFSSIDRGPRWTWQVDDAFVRNHELATLRPLVDVIRRQAQSSQLPLRVLESGCGDGINFAHLRFAGVTAAEAVFEGVDVTPAVVEEGIRRGMDIRLGDGLKLPYADATFDIAYCRDVFHHLADEEERKAFFHEMRRVTKPEGTVVAIEPNALNPAIFGLGLLVGAERGIWGMREAVFCRLLPGAAVTRVSPSAAWRIWYHYRSPFYRFEWARRAVRMLLKAWESLMAQLPQVLWSYRVYAWLRPLPPQHDADRAQQDRDVEQR